MILLTGAAGFIGSNLLAEFNRLGKDDIFVTDSLGADERYRNLIGKKFDTYLDKDMLFDWLIKHAKDITSVIHLGACTSTREKDMGVMLNENYYYSQKLFSFAADNKLPFIYASSSATYGVGENGFKDGYKMLDRLKPLGQYAFSKHIFDMWAFKQKSRPSRLIGLKFFNVYGPNEYHKGNMSSVIYNFINDVKNNEKIDIFYDEQKGIQKRDFIYVEDLVNIIMFCLDNKAVGDDIYNAGTSVAVDFETLAENVFDVMGRKKHIERVPMPPHIKETYQFNTLADMSKLYEVGYNHVFLDVKKGVEKYFSNYLKERKYK